jgi:hypothetical protein
VSFDQTAKRCRVERLGYDDGRPGSLEDIEARLAEMERCLRSWARSMNYVLNPPDDSDTHPVVTN